MVKAYGFGDNTYELHFKVSNKVVQYEVKNIVNGDIFSEQRFNATMDPESLTAPRVTAYSNLPRVSRDKPAVLKEYSYPPTNTGRRNLDVSDVAGLDRLAKESSLK